MKKTTTTSIQLFLSSIGKILPLGVLLFFGFGNNLSGQCSLVCNQGGQVSLDENCFAEVTPDDILEGSWDPSCEPFTVVVSATGGNFVTSNQLGQTVSVTITSASGNSCSGSLLVSDYLAPVINCQSTTISCFDNPDDVPAPTAFDNCDGSVSLTFTEQTQSLGCNGPFYQVITRNYTATDDSGNSSSCNHIINVSRPSLNQVVFPPDYDDIDQPALDCANDNTSTTVTGVPTIGGQPINGICEFAAGFTDQILPICQNSDKILREWTVNDWCNSTNITFTQTIEVTDKTPPNLSCPPNQVISVNSNDCFASLIVPNANVNDDCSSTSNIDIDVEVPEGYLNGNTLYNLPLGTHSIIYTATDDCSNSSTCTMQIEVIDEVAPVATCETNHVVNINGPGGSLVEAIVFDNGSYDNCSDLIYEVRRMDTPHCPGNDGTGFDAFAPFYCCDVGNTVMVELRVTDESGNSNSCMVEATVDDKVNPAITCPSSVEVDCGDDFTDLSLTGEPVISDNCDATSSFIDFENMDDCGGGVVNRTWTATDDSGNTASCVQQIFLVNGTPFFITDTDCNNPNPNDGVIWPCDFDTDACGPGLDPSITGEPEVFEDFCDLVAVTYEDVYLPIEEPACVKVLRTWTIVDWCQYDENSGSSAGSWEYTQVIKVLNSDDPTILSNCDDRSFCSYDENCENGPATLILEANDDCTDSLNLNYSYKIDLDNDGSIDIEAAGNDASGTYALGTHKIQWFVEDGCGNLSSCEYLFVIADCKAPTPNLLNGIAIEVMETCEIEIEATDFDNPSSPSFDNCGIQEWRIISPSEGPGQSTPPANASSSWTFSGIDDLGTQTVDIWIQDINGNWAYVSTYVLVQDNVSPFCEGIEYIQISGTIAREDEVGVEHVEVNLDAPGIPGGILSTSTDYDGQYAFSNLAEGGNYVLNPEKDINANNGVSTFDLVLIGRHILGVEELDSPYKMIAADANNSGSITTFDMIQIRKVILGLDPAFVNNTSWRFIEADFVFPNLQNPWETSFPNVISINGLETDIIADFVAVKIGDVNNSADPHDEFIDNQSESRSTQVPYILETINKSLLRNEVYRIPIYAEDLSTMSGLQFTLKLNTESLEVLNVQMGDVSTFTPENLNLRQIADGVITGSWSAPIPESLAKKALLFSIDVKAKEAIKLIDGLKLNSLYTKAEAYSNELEIMDLDLAFTEEDLGLIKLFQNTPNPFAESTTITFELADEMQAHIKIFDLSGKMVFYRSNNYSAGKHQIELMKNDLPGAGIYFYQLETPNGQSFIKKLVHTDRPEE